MDWAALKQKKFGVGLRRPHFDTFIDGVKEVDFLEILPENFMGFGGRVEAVLHKAKINFPIVTHGVSLSIAGVDPLNEEYLRDLSEFLNGLQAPWFSDHLSASSGHGVEYHDLLPFPYTREALSHVADRIKEVQDRISLPFLIENPSTYVQLPGEMSEIEFLCELLEQAECGLLLDVNNVYVNSRNHGFDPYDYVEALPAQRVLQMHIAGHDDRGEFLIDTHGAPVCDDVFELYRHALRHCGPAWSLLEWDNNIPSWSRLLSELNKVRAVAEEVDGA